MQSIYWKDAFEVWILAETHKDVSDRAEGFNGAPFLLDKNKYLNSYG